METRLLARLIDAASMVSPITAVTATPNVASRLASGTDIRAEVAAELYDGHFRVLIEGKPLVLKLPTGIKTGDVLQLRVIENVPQLKLLVGSAHTAASAPSGTNLSTAGRLVGALVSTAAGPPPRQARPIVDSPPVAPSEPSEPSEPSAPLAPSNLSGPLARAIERSGLFYESHQARWVGGGYALESLREEPQSTAQPRRPPTTAPEEGPAVPLPARGLPAPPPNDAIGKDLAIIESPDAVADSHTDPIRSDVAARETLPIVRQQLETLETRNLSWLGEIWPGQAMRWEISEDRPESEAETDLGDWSTRFGLTLPALGEVGATLVVTPKGVRVALSAQAAATVDTMRSAAPDLARAFVAAGVEPMGIQVIQDDTPV